MVITEKRKFIFFIFCFSALICFFAFKPVKVFAQPSNIYPSSEVPKILPRETWEDSKNLQDLLKIRTPHYYSTSSSSTPDYYPVSRIFIHSSDCQVTLIDGSRNPNCNSTHQETKSLIKNIYRYHIINKDYRDIGYHFIIGWNGEIFEGRYGGAASVGRHVSQTNNCNNLNIGSIGILLLGNLTSEEPSRAMKNSLNKLLGWLSYAYGLDPETIQTKSSLWKNKIKENGECDYSKGRFEGAWQGPVVSFYGEGQNMHSFNLTKVRQQAGLWKKHYSSFLYKGLQDNDIWALENGARISKPRIGSKVEEIGDNQLSYFPDENHEAKINHNDLVKLYDRPNVYLVNHKTLHWIPSRELFNSWRFKATEIKELTLQDLDGFQIADSLSYPSKTLLQEVGDGRVYIVNKDGTLSHITSLKLFNKLGLSWKSVRIISSQEMKELSKTNSLLFPTGTLIKGDQEKTVYLVASRALKPVNDPNIFQSHNFQWQDIVTLPQKDLEYYDMGSYLKFADNTILTIPSEEKSYLILSNRKHPLFNNFKNSLETQSFKVSKSNLQDYPLGTNLRNQADLSKLKSIAEATTSLISQLEANYDQFKVIKIGIDNFPTDEQLAIKSDKAYNVFNDEGLVEKKGAESFYEINLADLESNVKLRPTSAGAAFTVYKKTKNNLEKIGTFYGNINLEKDYVNNSLQYWIVNEVFIEDYLRGLEQNYLENNALTKAFIVASRSYLMHFYQDEGGRYKDKPFDLGREEGTMFYKGVTKNISLAYLEAVEQTEGEILTYNNNPARALYSHDTCGESVDAREVFGSSYKRFPYLWGGITDPQGTVHLDECPVIPDSGVGMSLAGARKLTEEGKKYYEILNYYYPNTRVEKNY